HHVAAHRAGEGLVLHLLPHGRRVDVTNRLRRLDQGDGGHEATELVDRVERLLHRGDTRDPGVIAVALDRVDDGPRNTGLLEDRLPVLRMPLRVPLVIEAMKEARDAPGFVVLAVPPRDVARRRFYGAPVLTEPLRLRSLAA